MKYFTIKELCANHYGVTNIPGAEETNNLHILIDKVLFPLREYMGEPITVTSGYRCKRLNDAVGGVKNSQHLVGQAADIDCDHIVKAFQFIRDNLDFDQLIWEGGTDKCPAWVHVSYRQNKNRNEVIIKIKRK